MSIDAQTPEVLAPSESPLSLLDQLGGAAVATGLILTAGHEKAGLVVTGSGVAAIALGKCINHTR